MLRIFVIADTHNKLPQKILDLARGADEIWHLGDVCEPTITDYLSAIGPPVTVVRGKRLAGFGERVEEILAKENLACETVSLDNQPVNRFLTSLGQDRARGIVFLSSAAGPR